MFDQFFERIKRGLLGQAYLLTASVEDSQDLLQEAMLRAWRHWDRVSALEDPEAWVRTVLHHLAIDRWRRRVTEIRYLSSVRSQERQTLDVATIEMADAMRALPPRLRRVVVLKAVVGLDTSEIADEVGASAGTVRVWLSRARRELTLALGEAETRPDEGARE